MRILVKWNGDEERERLVFYIGCCCCCWCVCCCGRCGNWVGGLGMIVLAFSKKTLLRFTLPDSDRHQIDRDVSDGDLIRDRRPWIPKVEPVAHLIIRIVVILIWFDALCAVQQVSGPSRAGVDHADHTGLFWTSRGFL